MNLVHERIGTKGSRKSIYEYAYTYDAMDRVSVAKDLRKKEWTSYRYDDLAQLTDATTVEAGSNKPLERSEYKTTLEGDWLGVTSTPAGGVAARTWNIEVGKGHRYNRFGEDSIKYDARGNLIFDGSRTYEYDPWDRLVVVKSGEIELARYAYDTLNRRTAKWVDNRKTTYAYDKWRVIEEFENNRPVRQYVHGDGLDVPVAMIEGSVRHYFHRDRLGNIVAVTDGKGEVVERYRYSLYGDRIITDGDGAMMGRSAIGNDFAFTGQRFDEESGLYYYRNRYYMPKFGRFLTKDPLGMVDGPNLYAYVNNDPQNWIDPMGTERYACPVPGDVLTAEDVQRAYDHGCIKQTYLSAYDPENAITFEEAYYKGIVSDEDYWIYQQDMERYAKLQDFAIRLEYGQLSPEQFSEYIALGIENDLIYRGYIDLRDAYENSYVNKAAGQVVVGECSADPDVSALGLAGQIGLGFTGVDLPADIRDIACKIHYGRDLGILDFVGFLPVFGVLKYSDEVIDGLKKSTKYVKNALFDIKRLDNFNDLKKQNKLLKEATETWAISKADPIFKNSEPHIDELMEVAGKNYDKITPEMFKIVDGAENAQLTDLKYALKEKDKLQYKVVDQALKHGDTLYESADNIKDALRYTVVITEKDFGKTVDGMLEQIGDLDGIKVIKVDNQFVKESSTYKGVNTAFELEDGSKFEVQFHTEPSHLVRNDVKNHNVKDWLERYKAIPEKQKTAEMEEIKKSMEKFLQTDYEKVPIPIDVQKIKSADDYADLADAGDISKAANQ
jgi:RHS repeat-associated protein